MCEVYFATSDSQNAKQNNKDSTIHRTEQKL